MKQLLFLAALLFISVFTFGQAREDWKEMHDFHAVMSSTFHPAEDDNLQPLKEKAGDLVAKAKAWQSSTVPQGYKAETSKPILANLVSKCNAIKTAVKKKKSDAELKKMITEAHDIFHEIMEKCKVEGDEKH